MYSTTSTSVRDSGQDMLLHVANGFHSSAWPSASCWLCPVQLLVCSCCFVSPSQLGSPLAFKGKAWPGAQPELHVAPWSLSVKAAGTGAAGGQPGRSLAPALVKGMWLNDLTDRTVSLSLCPRSADHSLPGSSVSTDFGSWQMVTGCGSIREQAILSADASLPCSFPDEFPSTCL